MIMPIGKIPSTLVKKSPAVVKAAEMCLGASRFWVPVSLICKRHIGKVSTHWGVGDARNLNNRCMMMN
jgi:hypothetical protein